MALLFSSAPTGLLGAMNWEVFESLIDSKAMQEAFKAINVDPSDACGLFKMLDLDNTGVVNAEEFLSGCLRLRGPAKALDLAMLIREVRMLEEKLLSKQAVEAPGLLEESMMSILNRDCPRMGTIDASEQANDAG